MLQLDTKVMYVKGIGPRIAEMLAPKGIETVEDLLYYLPFRYEDRVNPRSIEELKPGEMASVVAEVRTSMLFRTRKMPLFEVNFGQGRTRLKCLWFHGGYLKDKFKPGQMVALYGKVEESKKSRGGGLQIIQPQFEILAEPPADSGVAAEAAEREAEAKVEHSLEIGRIVPIYESAANQKLSSRWFRRIIFGALQTLGGQMPDGIPRVVRERMKLMERAAAFDQAHFPRIGESMVDLQAARTPAHVRLIFEELFFLEVGLELKRKRLRARSGISFDLDDKVRNAIKNFLPFHPTNAQKRVLREIADDMEHPAPMRRLLQGDVGSGKTIVALEAAVIAIENGYQAAMMAPTEILATQHYLSARRLLEPLGYRIVFLSGSLDQDQKRRIRRHIMQGDAQLIIGTHALIEEKVEFAKLGLVIVDEQHRFGVMQRFKLMKKGSAEPDVLVMTATPIPRTLALTMYGDLDTSVLDELPPGRTPITTRRLPDTRSAEVWDFVRKQVKAGYQAYVVYPVIEGVEEADLVGLTPDEAEKAKGKSKLGLKAAVHMYDELRKKHFPDLRVGLLHGKLDADEKDVMMRRFQRGEIDVLVSTTVIEVGVDVPNANIMVVEHAERFGLSQLHQLRGRIGRGAAKSYCVLMTGAKISEEADRRLTALVDTQDGFELAELDLELRGPGEFFGTRQAGMPNLRVANLLRDRKVLELAKQEAAKVVSGSDPDISKKEIDVVMAQLRSHWQRRYGLVEVG
ncbi:MAG TPA: ATP-dependent DNA helicase RecG [Terriglobales bacterium]|nr:ATP-dependent DNA helicase RecG [Terriglobales bacterium]